MKYGHQARARPFYALLVKVRPAHDDVLIICLSANLFKITSLC